LDRAVVTKVLQSSIWREAALAVSGTDRDNRRDSKKRAFNRARQALFTRGVLEEWGDWIWRAG
jgi:hypothetical protein